ncbi:MAG: type III-B CRISPR module RAMP protein Cmr6 [bacterium]
MNLPLPEYLRNITDNQLPNLSLRYYKWVNFYKKDFTDFEKETKDNKPKFEFLKKFVELSKQNTYNQAFETRRRLMENIGICFTMTTATRLVFGMGYEHPTEIGFMFDWTTGLPIIPGSSLKGVARDAAESSNDECLKEIFGSKKEDKEKCSGEIIFFPAYPYIEGNKPFFELDVMTPHYREYYSDKKPPADWYSPMPLLFLTVPAGIKYCFRLAHRNNLKDKKSTLLKKAENILKYSLTEFGVGAKTAVSYGYFK